MHRKRSCDSCPVDVSCAASPLTIRSADAEHLAKLLAAARLSFGVKRVKNREKGGSSLVGTFLYGIISVWQKTNFPLQQDKFVFLPVSGL